MRTRVKVEPRRWISKDSYPFTVHFKCLLSAQITLTKTSLVKKVKKVQAGGDKVQGETLKHRQNKIMIYKFVCGPFVWCIN